MCNGPKQDVSFAEMTFRVYLCCKNSISIYFLQCCFHFLNGYTNIFSNFRLCLYWWYRTEQSGMKHNGKQFPFHCLDIQWWNRTKLPLHHLGSERNGVSYNIFIPILPLFKKYYYIKYINIIILSPSKLNIWVEKLLYVRVKI
jgi:hypothetical protein